MTGKGAACDGQRDADVCVAVEAPAVVDREERNGGQSGKRHPVHTAHHMGRATLESYSAEGEPYD